MHNHKCVSCHYKEQSCSVCLCAHVCFMNSSKFNHKQACICLGGAHNTHTHTKFHTRNNKEPHERKIIELSLINETFVCAHYIIDSRSGQMLFLLDRIDLTSDFNIWILQISLFQTTARGVCVCVTGLYMCVSSCSSVSCNYFAVLNVMLVECEWNIHELRTEAFILLTVFTWSCYTKTIHYFIICCLWKCFHQWEQRHG